MRTPGFLFCKSGGESTIHHHFNGAKNSGKIHSSPRGWAGLGPWGWGRGGRGLRSVSLSRSRSLLEALPKPSQTGALHLKPSDLSLRAKEIRCYSCRQGRVQAVPCQQTARPGGWAWPLAPRPPPRRTLGGLGRLHFRPEEPPLLEPEGVSVNTALR